MDPEATLTTDEGTLRAVCFGQVPIADAIRSGDLSMKGDDQAVARLTTLLLTLVQPPD